jgi:1-acyl-sn-glycerol-3-phosphate acyltransferase
MTGIDRTEARPVPTQAGINPAASVIATLARLLFGVQVRWHNFQPDTRQRIYFGNHTSHLDALVIWSALPNDVRAMTRPVAARDYWTKNSVRQYLSSNVFRSVLIERPGKTPALPLRATLLIVEKMIEAMAESDSLIVFPEGTRGSGDEVKAFKSGLYHVALRKPGLDLVPVFLNNMNRILPKGEFLPVPLLGTVTFGAPLRLEAGEPKKVFLQRAREAVVQLRSL